MFSILPTPQTYVGKGAIQQVGTLINQLNARHVMVVTCDDLIQFNVYEPLKAVLEAIEGLTVTVYSKVQPDPAIEDVQAAVDLARKQHIDLVIGLGGGSPIDTAKIIAALAHNPQTIRGIIGSNAITGQVLPLIAIPTTAGTGSEVTPISILTDTENQLKLGVVSDKIIPRYAILEPEFTYGMPPKLTAHTGLDALSHAVEAMLSNNANSVTDFYAAEAITLIMANLRIAFQEGRNAEARTNMLMGSYFAGIAFANAGVTAAHAFAYPLGGRFHFPHGQSVLMMLPAVLDYNLTGNESRFAALAGLMHQSAETPGDVVAALNQLCNDLQIPQNLSQLGITREDLLPMAEAALKVTRLLNNNPRPITTVDEAMWIYDRAFHYSR